MKREKTGLALFWIGAACVFVAGWLVMWSGGLILLFFFAALWLCAKKRRTLEGAARTAADFQVLSYIFFLLTAFLMCALLGNPYSGLYFPERVIEQNALPWHYSFGTKAVVYLALAWFFTFLSHYKAAQAAR
jgi:hypothetical protein